MRVALDGRTMQVEVPGGIGRMLNNLVPLLAEQAELVLLLDEGLPPVDHAVEQVRLRTPVRAVSSTWLQLTAPRWLRGFEGVFHCPFYGLPFVCPVPGVVSLHDLSFEHRPELFSRRHLVSFRSQARHAARIAGCVLTPSEWVRADVIETYGVAEDRVLVSSISADPVFSPDADPAGTLSALGVDRPYVLAIGGAPRRNLPLAVAAWQRAATDHALVVVGREEPPAGSGAVFAGPVDDAALAGLLAGCAAFVYPTSYEGFGMPALEALASGAPVVATRNSALPEVLGSCAAWADSLAVDDLAAALSDLLSHPSRAHDLRVAGLARAAQAPTTADVARTHLEAYGIASTT
jgi:glycosyltransferase involved in cell wall biosynthesis